jgi:hypothetical protein
VAADDASMHPGQRGAGGRGSVAADDASMHPGQRGAGPTRGRRARARVAAWVLCGAYASCAVAPAHPGRPGGSDQAARSRCLGEATWVDRIEGDRVVLVTPDGAERDVALGSVGPDVVPGAAFFGPRPAPRCGLWIRAEIRATRARLLARPPPALRPGPDSGRATTAKATPER